MSDFNNETNENEEEENSVNVLRPSSFKDYIGQDHIKEELEVAIKASKMRNTTLSHMLFFGAPGLGKTTIANIIASEKQARIHMTSAPIIDRPADLVSTLMNLQEGDILFIDEIHALNTKVEESLYSVIEDFRLDINIDQGGASKLISIPIKPFTLIAATTKPGHISQPLRNRFSIIHQLKFYTEDELSQILMRSAKMLDIEITKDAAMEIAKRSRSTARIANTLLDRLMPFAIVRNDGLVDYDIAFNCLNKLDVDKIGLIEMDRKLLHCLSYIFKNKPVGLKSISPYISEDEKTIESVIEPFLIKRGLIKKTKKGRQLTDLGLKYVSDNIKENEFY